MSLPIVYPINLDIKNNNATTIHMHQYSKDATIIKITCMDGSVQYSITADMPTRFKWLKPDGQAVNNDCTINSDGTVSILCDEQMCIASGIALVELMISDPSGSGHQLTTPQFKVAIDKSVFPNDTITSTYEFNALNTALEKVDNIIPMTQKGAASGVCPLGTDSKVSSTYLPVGTANGLASLGSDGKVPSQQLPSYVDDVVECYIVGSTAYASNWLSLTVGGAPITPESGKIYIILTSGDYQNKEYRWTGSVYGVISDTIALGETSSTAYRGDRGKTAYDHSQTTGNAHNMTKADIGLGNVENFSVANMPLSDAVKNITSDLVSAVSTYAVGDLAIYNNVLYRCTTAITTHEAWNATHWTATTLDAEIMALKVCASYSTTPTICGKWYNGKDIYKKVIYGTTPTNNSTMFTLTGTVDEVVHIYGFVIGADTNTISLNATYASGTFASIYRVGSTSAFAYQCSSSSYESKAYHLVIEYTIA